MSGNDSKTFEELIAGIKHKAEGLTRIEWERRDQELHERAMNAAQLSIAELKKLQREQRELYAGANFSFRTSNAPGVLYRSHGSFTGGACLAEPAIEGTPEVQAQLVAERLERRRLRLIEDTKHLIAAQRLRKTEAKPPKKITNGHEIKIYWVCQAEPELEGIEYCLRLAERKIQPRTSWVKKGFPNSYPAAWRDKSNPQWKKKIRDERSEIMRKAPPSPPPPSKTC